MNNPEFYIKKNHLQRYSALQVLQEFGNKINWRCDGLDSILDAGCGPGDITVDILMPILPANFSQLVCIDISEAMINYARKTYVRPKLSFELFDLSKDLEKQPFHRIAKPFDHIFSFYVLMWFSNTRTCIQNFYKLLVPSGDMLLLYPNYHPIFYTYKEQSLDKRWAKYMWDVDEKLPPFQKSKSLRNDWCALLCECGFTDCDIRIRKRSHTLENIDSFREFSKAVSPFLDRLPVEDKASYVEDLMEKMIKRCIRPNGNEDKDEIIATYKDIMVYAKKAEVKRYQG